MKRVDELIDGWIFLIRPTYIVEKIEQLGIILLLSEVFV